MCSSDLSYGEHRDFSEPKSLSDFLEACMGSVNQGLGKAQHFAVGVVDLSTLLHQGVITLLFLALAALKIERLKH